MVTSKTIFKVGLALMLLSQSACATAQTSVNPQHTSQTVPHYSQLKPQSSSKGVQNSSMPMHEAFMRKFCYQHQVPYCSDDCRNIFLKEWAKQSVQSGKKYSREGFEQLDEYMKKGSHKAGEKWGEYYREFKRGAHKGYKDK